MNGEHDNIDYQGKDWDSKHPSLYVRAPHETAGVMRMFRAGYPPSEISKLLNLPGTSLMRSLRRALDLEAMASRMGLAIHDARVSRGYEG